MTTLPEPLQLALTPGAIVPVDVETTSALLAALRQLHEENKELREAAQQALEALEAVYGESCDAIHALRAALAEPVQEPVAWMYVNRDGECEQIEYEAPPDDPSITPLYTAPPQRTPLTEEEIKRIHTEWRASVPLHLNFARAIERAHGITGPEDKGG